MSITAFKMKQRGKKGNELAILHSVHENSAPRPNGLKWWPEYNVWALNKENAIRKSKNQ